MSDARKVRLEALAAVDAGNWKKAYQGYLELEKLEPEEGIWSQKAGDMGRRLNQPKEAVAAYMRAVDRYAGVGALVKAIAVCKLILEIDPNHSAARDKLAAMHGTPAATPPPPPPPRAHAAPPAAAHSPPPPPPARSAKAAAPLASL